MKYAYFPGCSLESTAKEYDLSLRAICRMLGVSLEEIPGWVCCGSSPAYSVDKKLSVSLPVPSLFWAEKNKLDILVPCASCFSRLKLSNSALSEDGGLLKEINTVLGIDFKAGARVLNLLDFFSDEIILAEMKKNQRRPLSGLKVACYYGCLLVRPLEIGFPNPENPAAMENIIKLLGAEPVDWAYKTECCGAAQAVTKPELMQKLVKDILEDAKSSGADCIACACPLCQSNLDIRQAEIEKKYKSSYGLPVLYITQLAGLFLGLDYLKLGLKRAFVDSSPLLKKKGLLG